MRKFQEGQRVRVVESSNDVSVKIGSLGTIVGYYSDNANSSYYHWVQVNFDEIVETYQSRTLHVPDGMLEHWEEFLITPFKPVDRKFIPLGNSEFLWKECVG